jgi:hypothetical protein
MGWCECNILYSTQGLWGKITDDIAKQMMKLLHDFTHHPTVSKDIINDEERLLSYKCFGEDESMSKEEW